MFFAAGVGAYHVAMFHLFTHAFFKALLFLGSGSVIHAFKDEQNINKMGGVGRKLPYTYIFMLIGLRVSMNLWMQSSLLLQHHLDLLLSKI